MKFTEANIQEVFNTLISVDKALKTFFENYLKNEYEKKSSERLPYLDIAEVSRFIIEKIKESKIDFLPQFFNMVEEILIDSDSYVQDLIVVGLFESIQNHCTSDIDYRFAFDKWLKPVSKLKWDNLIDLWAGKRGRR